MPQLEFKDYYKVMGVARDATEAQIKQAYRKLARKYHPDVSKEPDAEARFKEVGEAYEVLRSPEKRAAYDRLGSGPRPGEDFRPPPDWGSGFEFSGAGPGAGEASGDYSDFFEALFGRAAQGRARGGAVATGAVSMPAAAKIIMPRCCSIWTQPSPAVPGPSRCASRRSMPKDASSPRSGSSTYRCRRASCRGRRSGSRAKAARPHGEGKPGDLYIEVEFQPHPLYRIEGRDLYLELPVAPWEAALGAAVKSPTPTGTVELKIPPGSHAGSKLRLKGRGIPSSPPGDFYVVLQIALPPATDEKAGAAYRAFASAMPFNPRTGLGV